MAEVAIRVVSETSPSGYLTELVSLCTVIVQCECFKRAQQLWERFWTWEKTGSHV